MAEREVGTEAVSGRDVDLAVEQIAHSLTEVFEKVTVQASQVNELCGFMTEQADVFRRWNKLFDDMAKLGTRK